MTLTSELPIECPAIANESFKLGVVGPFVMQDLLTVWEPRNYFNKAKGKERQVFLFEQAIVIAKKVEFASKNVKYIIKGKPIPLVDVSVVEHVEGDACRFGLRFLMALKRAIQIGTVASNENRIDLRSAPQPKEDVKVMWIKRIRELTQALLPLNLGVGLEGVPPSGSSSSAASVSARSSNASANSFEYADETSSLDSQRLSVQSVDSNQFHLYSYFFSLSVLPLEHFTHRADSTMLLQLIRNEPDSGFRINKLPVA
ncbi:hypothetical protein ANCDUO_12957 [Ancylostoma duodenale]|uniref:SOS1/NGEF-like PH domain-containing protein n=1 Tax=Ancylostoma duodenale TaxID=51022 RepID=A0A0C2GDF2_9BILA|nr:hypothetical protein ANCDUO_12957 [Ancylostoma duodenale]